MTINSTESTAIKFGELIPPDSDPSSWLPALEHVWEVIKTVRTVRNAVNLAKELFQLRNRGPAIDREPKVVKEMSREDERLFNEIDLALIECENRVVARHKASRENVNAKRNDKFDFLAFLGLGTTKFGVGVGMNRGDNQIHPVLLFDNNGTLEAASLTPYDLFPAETTRWLSLGRTRFCLTAIRVIKQHKAGKVQSPITFDPTTDRITSSRDN